MVCDSNLLNHTNNADTDQSWAGMHSLPGVHESASGPRSPSACMEMTHCGQGLDWFRRVNRRRM